MTSGRRRKSSRTRHCTWSAIQIWHALCSINEKRYGYCDIEAAIASGSYHPDYISVPDREILKHKWAGVLAVIRAQAAVFGASCLKPEWA